MSDAVDFTNPPVTETMLGAWFSPLPWNSSHFGLYREIVRPDYPHFEDAAPIAPGNAFVFPSQQRGLYLTENRDVLLQIQQTMLYLNWRRLAPDGAYPRYREQLKRFVGEWGRFARFLETEAMPQPAVTMCQVSYVNHFEVPDGGTQGQVLGQVLAGSVGILAAAKQLNFAGVYPGNESGDLNIQIIPVLRATDNREMVQLSLTVNRAPESNDVQALENAFDIAHRGLIKTFLDITSDEARQAWGQK